VPITVAVLTFCAHHPDARWLTRPGNKVSLNLSTARPSCSGSRSGPSRQTCAR
jgi:hypothetical protein